MRNAANGLLRSDNATKVRRLYSDGRAYAERSDESLERRLSESHRVKSWPARLLIMGSELTAQKYRFVNAIRSSFTSGLNGCPQSLSGC